MVAFDVLLSKLAKYHEHCNKTLHFFCPLRLSLNGWISFTNCVDRPTFSLSEIQCTFMESLHLPHRNLLGKSKKNTYQTVFDYIWCLLDCVTHYDAYL